MVGNSGVPWLFPFRKRRNRKPYFLFLLSFSFLFLKIYIFYFFICRMGLQYNINRECNSDCLHCYFRNQTSQECWFTLFHSSFWYFYFYIIYFYFFITLVLFYLILFCILGYYRGLSDLASGFSIFRPCILLFASAFIFWGLLMYSPFPSSFSLILYLFLFLDYWITAFYPN